ncbi:MAG: glucose-6-phosphate isomerase, partial [Salibacteraceae bacterium]
MRFNIDPSSTAAWKELKFKQQEISSKTLKKWFHDDPKRFEEFSDEHHGLLFDYSKNRLDKHTLNLLLRLSEECKVREGIDQMFNGENINETEDRAVLHFALRNRSNVPVIHNGKDVMP